MNIIGKLYKEKTNIVIRNFKKYTTIKLWFYEIIVKSNQ